MKRTNQGNYRMKQTCSLRRLAVALSAATLFGLTACNRDGVDANSRSPDRERTAGEEMDDKTLSTSVRSALSGDSVKYPDIQVAAYRGVVQLSGFVDTRDHKDRASDVAKNVAGVR